MRNENTSSYDNATLTLQQAADKLQLNYITAYRVTQRGELPYYRKGDKIFICPADIEEYKRGAKMREGNNKQVA